jgi:hypothetical protein
MLSAAKIRPLESFFEPVVQKKPPRPDKETALSLAEGSIICLCDSPPNVIPNVLRTFHVQSLKIVKGLGQDSVRWTLVDDTGCWFEGSNQPVDLYQGSLIICPDLPARFKTGPYGLQAVMKFKLPWTYRIHHLTYLRRRFPSAVAQLHLV